LKVSLRQIRGLWDEGWVLDKHSVSSVYRGPGPHDFDTIRTEVGEATFQLKYRQVWRRQSLCSGYRRQHLPEALSGRFNCSYACIVSKSTPACHRGSERAWSNVKIPVFSNVLIKAKDGKSLKDLSSKDEKIDAIGDSFSVNDGISNIGKWNILVVDDLFHTGASMETACKVLRTYPKIAESM